MPLEGLKSEKLVTVKGKGNQKQTLIVAALVPHVSVRTAHPLASTDITSEAKLVAGIAEHD